jgi:hypothetical protein
MKYFLSFDETIIYEQHSKKGEDFRINLWNSLQKKSNVENVEITIFSFSNDELETIYPEWNVN